MKRFAQGAALSATLFALNATAAVGDITVVAGTGVAGHSGDGGAATAAQIAPAFIAVDANGSLYFTSQSTQTVRKVDGATGVISIFAGQKGVSSPFGYTGGDGIPATQTTFFNPTAIAVDKYGDVYVGELQGARLRRVDHWTGTISTVGGNGTFGNTVEGATANQTPLFYVPGVALGSGGDLFITDIARMGVWEINASTRRIHGVRLDPALFMFPIEIEVDSADNVYVVNGSPYQVLRVSPLDGAVETLVTSGTAIGGVAIDGADNVYFTNGTNAVTKRDAVTGAQTTAAVVTGESVLRDIEIDADGNLYAAGNARIYKIEGIAAPAGEGACR